MRQRADAICVVGIGSCTAVGNDSASTAAAVRAGVSGFKEHPFLVSRDGEPYILAMAPRVHAEALGAQRMVELAIPAAREACQTAAEQAKRMRPIPVRVGLPEQRPGIDTRLATKVADALIQVLATTFDLGEIETATNGHAAGMMAIESAADLLRQGKAEFCLAGGVDSYIEPNTLDWIEDKEQLHVSDNAWGFIPGEAAAFCLLCTEATAASYGLPVQSRLVAISTAVEQNRIKTDTICIGEGLTRAVASLLQDVPTGHQIRFTYCDQNGEPYRADEFGFLLSRLSERFENIDAYLAPADCWGDVGAASGPLFLGLHATAAHKKYPGGELSLLWTSSEGGERSAALLDSPDTGRRVG